ncbi:hypothetical protein [Nocardioides sp.]|uniref:hypothetical protein n=1 Tax=Nocardioides sp. TaxID=35761 RepID=UPI0035193784
MSTTTRPRPLIAAGGVALVTGLGASLLLGGCGTDGQPSPVPSGTPASAGTPGPEPAPTCATTSPRDADGFTPPDTVLCPGATARVPFRTSSDADAVPVQVRVTGVRRSTDATFDPGQPDLGGLPVWLVDYRVSAEAPLRTAAWEVDGAPTAVLSDGGGERTLVLGPADCDGPPGPRLPTRWVAGCAWVVGSADAEPTGVEVTTLFDPGDLQDPLGTRSVLWALDARPLAPA